MRAEAAQSHKRLSHCCCCCCYAATALYPSNTCRYSKLSELQVLFFCHYFLAAVRDLIDSSSQASQPLVSNTWGDAFYFVFSKVQDAGNFALRFSQLVTATEWTRYGLPSDLSIRISLHAAPVFVVTDPITKTRNYTGVHTSMAARIEPITPPGLVYSSQAYACMVETLGVQDLRCTYVGNVPLAKDYGFAKLYHVKSQGRRGSGPSLYV